MRSFDHVNAKILPALDFLPDRTRRGSSGLGILKFGPHPVDCGLLSNNLVAIHQLGQLRLGTRFRQLLHLERMVD